MARSQQEILPLRRRGDDVNNYVICKNSAKEIAPI